MYARYIPPKNPLVRRIEEVVAGGIAKKRKRSDNKTETEDTSISFENSKQASVKSKARAGSIIHPSRQALHGPGILRDEILGTSAASATTATGHNDEPRRKKKKKQRTSQDDELRQIEYSSSQLTSPGVANQQELGGRGESDLQIVKADKSVDQPKKSTKKKKTRINEARPGGDAVRQEGLQIDQESNKHKSILARYRVSTQAREANNRDNLREAPTQEEDTQPDTAIEQSALAALPQPPPVKDVAGKPTFAVLPPWLAHPITVSPAQQTSLETYSISASLLKLLERKGFTKAFAIQSAVLPLLLPVEAQHDGDLCISAATGSGKTLAYVIPLVESLRNTLVTKLRGLIVVPTRELVTQAREVCELCCTGSKLKVKAAIGSRPFGSEQEDLIGWSQEYNGTEAQDIEQTVDERSQTEYDPAVDNLDLGSERPTNPGHLLRYYSKADILVCTPGRLVEHIRSTHGFSLDDLEWLIIDEADKLLGQSFQGWVEAVLGSLQRDKSFAELPMDQKIARRLGWWQPPRFVRKVVLSATMTRDLSKLNALKLKNPRLVAVSGAEPPEESIGKQGQSQAVKDMVEPVTGEGFEIPFTLREMAVSVGDGSQKPLYLLRLLQTKILPESTELDVRSKQSSSASVVSSSDDGESSESSESSESHSTTSMSSSANVSDDDDSDSSENNLKSQAFSQELESKPRPPSLATIQASRGVLIFTRSNESAARLSRLIVLMHPPYASSIGTLTSNHPSAQRKRTLRAFHRGKLCILIASNLVSRGIDLVNLAHVVNYDIPTNVHEYVHRVGRTARAGKDGVAWTLITDKEAGWFWNAIARGNDLRRVKDKKVSRFKVDLGPFEGEDEEGRSLAMKAYEDALKLLGEEVRQEKK